MLYEVITDCPAVCPIMIGHMSIVLPHRQHEAHQVLVLDADWLASGRLRPPVQAEQVAVHEYRVQRLLQIMYFESIIGECVDTLDSIGQSFLLQSGDLVARGDRMVR